MNIVACHIEKDFIANSNRQICRENIPRPIEQRITANDEEYLDFCSHLLSPLIRNRDGKSDDLQSALLYILEYNIKNIKTTKDAKKVIRAIPRFRLLSSPSRGQQPYCHSLNEPFTDHGSSQEETGTLLDIIPAQPLEPFPIESGIAEDIDNIIRASRKHRFYSPPTRYLDIVCRYCQSNHMVKFGFHVGKRAGCVQRYWCKECRRKQTDNIIFNHMYPGKIIAAAINLRYEHNLSYRHIATSIYSEYNTKPSFVIIKKWVEKKENYGYHHLPH